MKPRLKGKSSQANTFLIILLLGVFAIALVVRLVFLGMVPEGFHVDELNAGYVGRYILIHGKDIFGNVMPLAFNKFGDFRPTGIFYLSGLSTFIFGITEFAVRFPSAFFGALSVFPLFFLVRQLTRRVSVGIVAAGVLAVLPWHVVLSRATSESVIGLFFTLSGLWFMVRSMETKQKKDVLYGSIFLAITYFFYHTFRALVPFLVLGMTIMAWKTVLRSHLIAATVVFFLITLGLSVTSVGTGRLDQIAFHKNKSLESTLVALASADHNIPLIVTRVFHNKPVVYAREFAHQYLSYFAPSYLFLSGGYPDRYRIPENGLFPIILAPMFALGLLVFWQRKDDMREKWFMLFFLMIAAIPAAITYEDSPNVQRSMPLMVPIIFFMAYGADVFFRWIYRKKLVFIGAAFVIGAVLIFETGLFLKLYFVNAASHKSLYRNQGTQELLDRVKVLYPNTDHVVMPILDELPMYTAFYLKKFDTFPGEVYRKSIHELTMDKAIFVDTICPLKFLNGKLTGRVLYVNYEGCDAGDNVSELTAIMRGDSTMAYRLYLSK